MPIEPHKARNYVMECNNAPVLGQYVTVQRTDDDFYLHLIEIFIENIPHVVPKSDMQGKKIIFAETVIYSI